MKVRTISALAGALLIGNLAANASATAETFRYDALGRLTHVVSEANATRQYAYDKADNQRQVTVGTAAPNQAPIALDDAITTSQNTAVAFDPRGNDWDPDGDVMRIGGLTGAAHGGIALLDTGFRYTPYANFVGTDSFTYNIIDGRGGSDWATVTITVQ